MGIPNILLFRTKNKSYLYDVNTNRILNIRHETYYYLYKICNGHDERNHDKPLLSNLNTNQHSVALSEYNTIKKDTSLLLGNNINYIGFKISDIQLTELLNNHLEQLTLELTQACNFRCSYCIYGGNYYNQREHNNSNMSVDVIKRALNFYIKRCDKIEKPVIGFYGGEPLLCYDNIIHAYNYANKIKPNNKFRWQLTTNGYLLDDKIIKFLVENNFTLWVSFDGDIKNHDINRKTIDGKETARHIYDKLSYIVAKYPEYAKKSLYLSQLSVDNHDLLSFVKDNVIYTLGDKRYPLNMKLEFVSQDLFKPDKVLRRNENYDKLFSIYYKHCINCLVKTNNDIANYEIDKIDNIFGSTFTLQLFLFMIRSIPCLYRSDPMGMCIPGHKKLFIDVNGIFHLFEKINNKCSIGNINDGFDINKIKYLMTLPENLKKKECLKCVAVRLCGLCLAPIWGDGEINNNMLDTFCKSSIRSFKNNIKQFCIILENNDEAFDNKLLNYIFIKVNEIINDNSIDDCSKNKIVSLYNDEKSFVGWDI